MATWTKNYDWKKREQNKKNIFKKASQANLKIPKVIRSLRTKDN